jgi:hypothetical protein
VPETDENKNKNSENESKVTYLLVISGIYAIPDTVAVSS